METEIRNKPSFANIRLKLGQGDQVIAEADAMASMSSTLDINTEWSGGFSHSAAKRICRPTM